MGKLAVKKYFQFILLSFGIVIGIFTFIGLLGGDANPATSTATSMTIFVLPILVVVNLLMVIYWAVRKAWKFIGINLIPLLFCIPYVGTFLQLRTLPYDGSTPGVKIATYNVARFNNAASGFLPQDILSVMKQQNVDVFCIQEYAAYSGDNHNTQSYKEYFPYVAIGKDDMVIFSRYPIVKHKAILFDQTNNSAMWADINVNGKVMRVYNVHLETTGFNSTLRRVAKMQYGGSHVESNAIVGAVYDNYTLGMIARAGQANIIANEMVQDNKPAVLCGDFNDVPYSYVYNTLKGNMTDGFKECGSGFMYTYRGLKKFRIDYLFHSSSLEGITYYKLDLTYSDHYPVFMKVKF